MISRRLRTLGRGGPAAVILASAILFLSGCGGEEETGGADAGAAGAAAASEVAPAGRAVGIVVDPPIAFGAPDAAVGAPAPAPSAGAVPTGPVIEAIELNEWYRVVLVNPAAINDPLELEAIARPFCDGLETCRIGLWYSEADFPRQLPVPGYQLSKQVFAFGRTLTGAENALWNCDTFPELQAPGKCLPRALD